MYSSTVLLPILHPCDCQRYVNSHESVSHAATRIVPQVRVFVCEPLPHFRLKRSSQRCLLVTVLVLTAMSGFRQRTANKKSRSISPVLNGSANTSRENPSAKVAEATSVAGALLDYSLILLLVFGGCCSYVSISWLSCCYLSVYLSLTETSGPMRNCSAQSLALVCIESLFHLAMADPSSPHRTRAHLFANALYHYAATALFRDVGQVAMAPAIQTASGPHLAVALTRHYICVWEPAEQSRVWVQRPPHDTNHIPFGRCVPFVKKKKFLVSLTRGGVVRTSRVDDPRPPLHGEAIHAPTNSTALSPLLSGGPTAPADRHPFSLSLHKTAVAVVSSGVVLATLSRPSANNSSAQPPSSSSSPAVDTWRYPIGVAMLLLSLVCTGAQGIFQERTYSTYGPHWREGVFYMVCS